MSLRLLRVALLAGLVLPLLAAPAHAVESYALQWGASCTGTSGQTDEQGRMYIPCGGTIRIYNPAGAEIQNVPGVGAIDIAPSPDGTYIYYATGWGIRPNRLVRTNTGAYVADNAWAPQQFMYAGQMRTIRTSHLATDAWGNLYVAEGYWVTNGLNTVAKFAPDGSFVTRFGTFTSGARWDDPRHFEAGAFYWGVSGLAVSRDGRRVYTSEVGNNRVQRFDWNPDGEYRPVTSWGNTINDLVPDDPRTAADESRANSGSCAPGKMAAPYDVGIDGWGFVYVANTTCTQIQKFTGDGQFVYSMYVGAYGPNQQKAGERDHYIAVDAHGSVYNTELGHVMRRTSPEPGPWPTPAPLPAPDRTAPVVSALGAPASTSTRTVTLTITATDNRGVTQMRFAGADGVFGAWIPFATQHAYTLPEALGTHAVTVQVRDAAALESNTLTRTIDYRGDDQAPAVTGFTAPTPTYARTVNLAIAATDNTAVTQMRIAGTDGTWSGWMPYATQYAHTVGANYGMHAVTLQVRDARGNESTTVTRMVEYRGDDQAPVLTAFTAPTASYDRTVALTFAATDAFGVTQMRFADADGTWSLWQAYTTTRAFTLPDRYGAHVVTVQVRDAAGHESNTLTRTIDYRADDETPTLTSITAPVTTTVREVTVDIAASDNIGVAQVRMADETGTWRAWRPFAPSVQYALTPGYGGKGVFVQVRDAAGNESRTLYRAITVPRSTSQDAWTATGRNGGPAVGIRPGSRDRVDPRLLRAKLGKRVVRGRTVVLRLSATDNVGVVAVRFADARGGWGRWQRYGRKLTLRVPRGRACGVLNVQVRDAAGNESRVVTLRFRCAGRAKR